MPNLLQKASIVLTPTAYDNGKVLCAKPSEAPYGDFDFSRNSAATRVNSQGLVEDVQILSSNLVQNGDFSQLGSEEVTNGNFSQQGSQLVTNGDFATDTNWIKGTGWSISGGSLNASNVNGISTTQGGYTFLGKIFKVSYTISDYSQGSVQIYLGGSQSTSLKSENGTHTETISVSSGNTVLYIYGISNFTGSIDNVSVVEVGQDWIFGTGWSIGEDKAVADGTTNNALSQTTISSVVGKSYKIDFTIDDYVTGNIRIYFGGVFTPFVSNDGVYSFYITATAVDVLTTSAYGLFNGSITNISVKEVGQNWNLLSNTSIGENKLICDNVTANTNICSQNSVVPISKLFKVQYNIIVNSGAFRILLGSSGTTTQVTTSGTYTFFETSGTGGTLTLQARSGGFDGSITNISVIEITDDTNLPRINYEGFSFDGSGNIIPDSGCGSWLFEPQSTNLVTQSELLNGYWLNSGSNSLISDVISPDGISFSQKVTTTTAGNFKGLLKYESTNWDSKTLTISTFAKKGNTDWLYFYNIGSNNGNNGVWFNLDSGLIGTIGAAWSNVKIETFQNGWYRCSATLLFGAATNYLYILNSDANNSVFSALNKYAYIWGTQIEENNITSYIPTDGTQKTRNQDVCTNGGSVSTINSTEGVLYFEGSTLVNSGNRFISLKDNATSQQRMFLRYDQSGTITYRYYVSGSIQINIVYSAINPLDNNKIACKWELNNFSLWVNGTKVGEDLSGNVSTPSTYDKLQFNEYTNSNNFFGKTKCVAVWKEALTDTELQELTTI